MRQTSRGQRQHHLVHARQSPLPLHDDLRLEAAAAVAGHVDLDRPDVGQHSLGAASVAGVPATRAGRVVLLISEVVGDLALQGGFQHALGQLLQQSALAGQLQAPLAGPIDQLPDQLVVQQVCRQIDRPDLFNRLDGGSHVAHQVFFLDRELHR